MNLRSVEVYGNLENLGRCFGCKCSFKNPRCFVHFCGVEDISERDETFCPTLIISGKEFCSGLGFRVKVIMLTGG